MPPTIVYKYAPAGSYVNYPNRPHRGVILHHTADPIAPPYPSPSPSGSWGVLFPDRNEIIVQAKPNWAMFHVLKTDYMRPSWLLRCPDGRVSDANYCTDGWEIEYAPQSPNNESPTTRQVDNIRWYTEFVYQPTYGANPFLGHGQVQSDKWRTEPHNFPWGFAGFGPMQPNVGRFYLGVPDDMNPADDATIKGWLEAAGMPVNMNTAIMQFAAEAFRNGAPPVGNWRGPALPAPGATVNDPGEYPNPADPSKVRHRFTAGIAEFDTVTGGLGWVELVKEHGELQ